VVFIRAGRLTKEEIGQPPRRVSKAGGIQISVKKAMVPDGGGSEQAAAKRGGAGAR